MKVADSSRSCVGPGSGPLAGPRSGPPPGSRLDPRSRPRSDRDSDYGSDRGFGLDRFAAGAEALIQAYGDTCASLSRVCTCLEELLEASAVTVHHAPGGPSPATNGRRTRAATTSKLDRDAILKDLDNDTGKKNGDGDHYKGRRSHEPHRGAGCVRVTTAGVSLTMPVSDQGRLVGCLRVTWSEPPEPARWLVTRHIVRFAGTLCASDIDAAVKNNERTAAEPDGIAGRSDAIRALRIEISQAASCAYPVLIEGETAPQQYVQAV